ncbi:MAG: carbohydrate porin [Myxococcota bacterium]
MRRAARARRARALLPTLVLVGPGLAVQILAASVAGALLVGSAARAEANDVGRATADPASLDERTHPLPAWRRGRELLARAGLRPEAVYTLDVLRNAKGGLARKTDALGNLDLTLTWQPEAWLGRDLGTFFLYGLVNHGGRPSRAVGDGQIADNIEAPDAARLFEAWWQKGLLDGRASLLLGLYDVNSEFYAVESAELFVNSAFGMGSELGNSGRNGPSIFPATSLGARVKLEPVHGYEFQAAVLDGVPGDPDHPARTRIELGSDDGAFLIAELARHWQRSPTRDSVDVLRRTQRRRIGRAYDQIPDFLRIAIGSWLYTARLPHLARTGVDGEPAERHGLPGVYLIADFDATALDPLHARGLSAFLQAGWADGDVGPYAGYFGGGFKYTGLIAFRPQDETGFAVAAALNGRAYTEARQRSGERPAAGEVAFEWTHRVVVTPWLSLQGDLQYVLDPGGLKSRSDALIGGIRFVVSL